MRFMNHVKYPPNLTLKVHPCTAGSHNALMQQQKGLCSKITYFLDRDLWVHLLHYSWCIGRIKGVQRNPTMSSYRLGINKPNLSKAYILKAIKCWYNLTDLHCGYSLILILTTLEVLTIWLTDSDFSSPFLNQFLRGYCTPVQSQDIFLTGNIPRNRTIALAFH